ncbi:MAG: sigma 54-interacting transcriptional regulator [Deltaproteobacteria bacterium]|nr:sigma 54-interacting transcriptional regulator [Deltaproteobacteria bacterium]
MPQRPVDFGVDPATSQTPGDAPARPPGLRLVVVTQAGVHTHPLPDAGVVSIGRSPENDISIDDASVSRQHCLLHMGWSLQIEDVGSANGTRVHDHPIERGERVDILPGDSIDIASVMVMIQQGMATQRPRRVGSHGYFEVRLEEECARAARTGGIFVVARLHVEGEVEPAVVQRLLVQELHPDALLAAYGPNEYEVLLPDAAKSAPEDLARRLNVQLAKASVQVRAGAAQYPTDGRAPEALIAAACEAVAAKPAKTGRAVLIIEDEGMRRLYQLVDRIASGTIHVLLLGETGVGKEVIAETIHRKSSRAGRELLRLNCAALPENLLESELFGHERGAFTGAAQSKKGLLETATGGTVFLDEVGELPLATQAKLLRVIEEQKVLPVGSLKQRDIDVRFIAATNRNLEDDVRAGKFREDLYYRLNGVSLVIPPLRERMAEIEPLARAFVAQASQRTGKPEPKLTPEALDLLRAYSWPGNIRELRNVVERAVLLASDDVIGLAELPVDKMGATIESVPALPWGAGAAHAVEGAPAGGGGDIRREIEAMEKQRILAALSQCGGNQTRAAKILGMPRRTFITRLDQYGISRPRRDRGDKTDDD